MTVVRRALIVGINAYAVPGANLRGCVNDALTMAKLVTENYGFPREEVRLLVDERATTANIRRRLAWLVQGAGPGSVLLFHFSGHGSQVRDRGEQDELDDGLDEVLCPHDMNWDDPFTDDELRAVVESISDGVNLTLILDCCHSGTGTREFFKEPELRGARSRFLAPPPDVGFRTAAGVDFAADPERTVNMRGRRPGVALRRFGTAYTEQNALLIAGCRSDQTSADAWIDNDHRGALTYSLYRAIRLHDYQLSYRDLARESGNWLEANGFSQVPQLEGPAERQGWSFLGVEEHAPASAAPGASATLVDSKSDALLAPTTQVVFVHGIGHHEAGYSESWRAAFNRYLHLPLGHFHEVVWDSVFDERARGAEGTDGPAPLNRSEQADYARVLGELQQVLAARSDLAEDIAPSDGLRRDGAAGIVDRTVDRGFVSWLMNPDEYLGDFVKYLVSKRVRAAVDECLSKVLEPLLRSGRPVVLISHSWGTVVGYHTLRSVANGRLALHCTLGSPLWMGPVRGLLELDGRRHACRRWINVDAHGDLIGGRLAGDYDVQHDYKVPSVGGQPHGSYFHPDNALVQRDIVAEAIRESGQLDDGSTLQPRPKRAPKGRGSSRTGSRSAPR